jgi:MoxR-like ATPase
MKLNLKSIPKMVGQDAKNRFNECYTMLTHTSWPLYLVGPSGSGKTLMAMNLAKKYAIDNGVPAYYAQLSPDQTKTSLILGLRLVNGTLKPVKGMVAEAMERGGIVVVDEATHTTQEMLLMFNSILDRTSVTSIGDEIVYAKDTFRVVFCSNSSTYAGNVRLPQSFAQRVVTFNFDYPSREDEIKIAQKVAKEEYSGEYDVPDSVASYLTSFVREIRSDAFPLSARNIAVALIRLAVMPKKEIADLYYFSSGSNVESIRRNLAKRIMNQDVNNAAMLTTPEIRSFMEFVGKIGVQKFKEAVLSSCMYYLDVDGTELNKDVLRNKIATTVI